MKVFRKKFLASFLAVLMLFSTVPVNALELGSSQNDDYSGVYVEESTAETSTTEESASSNLYDGVYVEQAVPSQPDTSTQDELSEDTNKPEETQIQLDEELNFSSKRLIIVSSDAELLKDDNAVISSFEDVYLLQYDSEDDAKRAYAFYEDKVDFIEIDAGIEAANNDLEPVNTDTVMTEDENPFTALNEQIKTDKELQEEQEKAIEDAKEKGEEPPVFEDISYDIALIDTGVSENDAVKTRLSMIGDDLDADNLHGDKMVEAIISQNPDASILSIKVLDKNGKGDISAVYAAIQYAITQKVKVINLSMSAFATQDNSILANAIKQANDAGIVVVGAAGNNGKNAKYFVPANIDDALIVGAADENGKVLEKSNTGDTVDYNVVAESTSEAAALMSGFISKNGILSIHENINNGLIFATDFKPAEETTTPEKEESDDQSGEFKAADGIVSNDLFSIREFSIDFVYGANKLDNGKYVWTPSSSDSGHRFTWRVNYALSGIQEIPAGAVKMVIPMHVLKDRAQLAQGLDDFADVYEMSLISEAEYNALSPEELRQLEHDFVYYEEDGNLIIYNVSEIPAGYNGYFEVSYLTSEKTFEYQDCDASDASSTLGRSDEFTASIEIAAEGHDTISTTANGNAVYMDTTAKIISTEKRYPNFYKGWQSSWGTAPSDADNYYYLVWEIRSNIDQNITQPYTFTLDDSIISSSNGDVEVVGYRMSGSTGFSNINYVENVKTSGYRFDSVLTRMPKSVYEPLEKFEVVNGATATVTPSDLIDASTNATSQKKFIWEKPHFTVPYGHFNMWKRADGAWREHYETYGYGITYLSYLGNKAGEYSRYDLQDFQEGKLTSYGNFDYAVWLEGYPYPWTMEDGADPYNPDSYGKVPVKYVLSDEEVYLGDGSSSDISLDYNDYQIDSIAYGFSMNDAVFNEDTQKFTSINVTYTDDDVLVFFGKFGDNDEWIQIGTRNLKTDEIEYDSEFVTITKNKIIPNSGTNMVGYKVETSNAHYFTKIDTVPNISLKNSEKVMDFIQGKDAIHILNVGEGHFYDHYNWQLLAVTEQDMDFARISVKDSQLTKTVVAASNNTKNKSYVITWKLNAWESITSGESGTRDYIVQDTGTFYDLLPKGSIVDVDSISVQTNEGYLSETSYTVTQIPNYADERTMLIVHVNEAAKWFNVYFDTIHAWDSIKDYGNDVYNPVAFETGNDDIKDGYPDNGGNLVQDKEYFVDLDNTTDANRFIYAAHNFDIAAITAAASGLTKKVLAGDDKNFTYDTTTTNNGYYQYRLRFMNTYSAVTKDMVFFDSLENYKVDGEKASDWHGTLRAIDVSQLIERGIVPVVYISTVEGLDIEANHDISDTSVWTQVGNDTDLSQAKAIAVDMRKTANDEDFILQAGESVSVILHMQAPASADSQEEHAYPEAYNNIYISNTPISVTGETGNTALIHQDYTTVKFVVAADLRLRKVSSENQNEGIPKISFKLVGTSYYGTEVEKVMTSDRNGAIIFKDIERGEYMLQEYETTEDWLLDTTEHQVVIDGEGKLFIDGEEYTDLVFTATNKPRAHGDLSLVKMPEYGAYQKDKPFKYAVSLYGIGVGVDKKGNPTGLTFGPALGESYINSYKSHTPTGTTAKGNEHRCIHDDDWATIIGWNFDDPEVYEQCIAEGCTHSVELQLPESLKSTTFVPTYTGDGPSALNYELRNTPISSSDNVAYNGANSRTGGWGASRIRAMMNGYDDLTNPDVANGTLSSVEQYVKGNRLIDGFPVALQRAIATQKVVYDPNYNSQNMSNVGVSYDKLWLLSPNEIWPSNLITNYYIAHPMEGTPFPYFEARVDQLNNCATSSPILTHYRVLSSTGGDYAFAGVMWLRSVFTRYTNTAIGIRDTGAVVSCIINYAQYDVAPCFSLTTDESIRSSIIPASSQAETSVEYAAGIPNTTFKLSGMSDYGNEVSMVETTDERGRVSFKNIEKGTYTLEEVIPNDNFVINNTKWVVVVDDNGNVTLNEPANDADKDRLSQVEQDFGTYVYTVRNENRYWDFKLYKIDATNPSIYLEGATFNLQGISDLGTEYNITATTNSQGFIQFQRLEKGSYILKELQAPQGVDENGQSGGNRNYITDPRMYVVNIGYDGVVTIDGLTTNSGGELAMENERALDGKITITKIWDDYADNDSRPIPKLHLSTREIPMDRNITINVNWTGQDDSAETRPSTIKLYVGTSDGTVLISKTFNLNNPSNPTTLTMQALLSPNTTYYVWADDASGYESQNPINRKAQITQNEVGARSAEITMKKRPVTKYAVALYGIGVDVDENGNTLGLTFGPALGENYGYTTKPAHIALSSETADNMCIHNHTWAEIVAQNNINPYAFHECIANGCTKTIVMDITGTLRGIRLDEDDLSNVTGDGVSSLQFELSTGGACDWNNYENGDPSAYASTTNGWGGSNVRAVLNGYDELTNDDVWAKNKGITEEKSLFGMFPEELQNAIAKRKTNYDPIAGNNTEMNLRTSYDKLWLLSTNEVCETITNTRRFGHPLEGTVYEKFIGAGDEDNEVGNAMRKSFWNNDGRVVENTIWTRSLSEFGGWVDAIRGSGKLEIIISENHMGLSPCFALSSNYNFSRSSTLGINDIDEDDNLLEKVVKLFATEVRAAEDDIASGTSGTCSWVIDSSGVLTIAPTEGDNGTLGSPTSNGWPWTDYASQITKVVIANGVKTGANCSKMFSGFVNCTEMDLANLDTANATNMSQMFTRCTSLERLNISGWNTSNVTNMSNMFSNCGTLEGIDFSALDTSNVTDMSYMFSNCAFTSFNGGSLDTSNVTNMRAMFSNSKLTSVDVSGWGWDTSNVTNMMGMFSQCSNLKTVNLNAWNTQNVTTIQTMFNYCYGLREVKMGSWDTRNLTDMWSTFAWCSNLESIDIGKWDTPKLEKLYSTFSRCEKLKELDLSGWDTSHVNNMEQMISYTTHLEVLNLGNFNYDSVTSKNNMLSTSSSNLSVLVLNSNFAKVASYLYGPQSDSMWIHKTDGAGNKIYDAEPITFSALKALSADEIAGKWVREGYIEHINLGDGDVEYISEDDGWVKDGNVWTYTFDVFDDTLEYYLYEEPIEGYTSEAMDNYLIVNKDGVVTKVQTIVNKADVEHGSLEVEKIVEGTNTNLQFDFTITLRGPMIDGNQVFSDVLFVDGVAHIKLRGGESKVIDKIPAGTTYTVYESPVNNYVTTSTNETGTIETNTTAKATFTNSFIVNEDGVFDVVLEKLVNGEFDNAGSYNFVAQFTGLEPGVEYVTSKEDISFVADTEGKANITFTVDANDNIHFLALPAGATYVFTEEAGAYTASYKITDANNGTSIVSSSKNNTDENLALSTAVETVDPDELATVTFTNTIHRTVSLKLTKQVVSEETVNDEFSFEISFSNLPVGTKMNSTAGRFVADTDGEASKTITLADGDVFEITGIPVGAKYQITEAKNRLVASYRIEDANDGGNIVMAEDANTEKETALSTSVEVANEDEDITVTFINTYVPPQTAKVQFKKFIGYTTEGSSEVKFDEAGLKEAFDSLNLDRNATYSFRITMEETTTHNKIQGILTTEGTLVFNNVPLGTYTVVEADDNYFDFVSMVGEQTVNGFTFNGRTLTISEDVSDNAVYTIDVTNKLEPTRYYEEKEEKENYIAVVAPQILR